MFFPLELRHLQELPFPLTEVMWLNSSGLTMYRTIVLIPFLTGTSSLNSFQMQPYSSCISPGLLKNWYYGQRKNSAISSFLKHLPQGRVQCHRKRIRMWLSLSGERPAGALGTSCHPC